MTVNERRRVTGLTPGVRQFRACPPIPSHLPALVCGLAFVLGAGFGAVAHRANFCTMGAVADIVTFGDWRRMRMWLLAIAVAIAGVAALQAAGQIDLAKSIYTGAACPGCRCWSAGCRSASG